MSRLAIATVLMASFAWADIPPMNSSGCHGAKAGSKCKTDASEPGTCVKSTCSRNDYSDGPPPKLVPYECLVCTATPDAGSKK